jgi:hypothetical protein
MQPAAPSKQPNDSNWQRRPTCPIHPREMYFETIDQQTSPVGTLVGTLRFPIENFLCRIPVKL